MTDLYADIDRYLEAVLRNEPPPPIDSDPLVVGTTPIEDLLRILGLAANADDADDAAEGLDEHARRKAAATNAADKFAAQDQSGVAQLAQVATGIAGAVAGALGGALQPLAQIPQQVGQGLTQALQSLQDIPLTSYGDFTSAADDSAPLDLGDPVESDPIPTIDDESDRSDSAVEPPVSVWPGGTAGPEGIAATAALGPALSPGTPASAPPAVPASARSGAVAAPGPGFPGMPVVPPPLASTGEKDAKTNTKRVSVPTVRNGAPVQGRLTALPLEATPPIVERAPVTVRRNLARDRTA